MHKEAWMGTVCDGANAKASEFGRTLAALLDQEIRFILLFCVVGSPSFHGELILKLSNVAMEPVHTYDFAAILGVIFILQNVEEFYYL